MYKKISQLFPVDTLAGGDLFLVARGESSYSFDAGRIATLGPDGKLSASVKPAYSYSEIANAPARLTKLSELTNDMALISAPEARRAISVAGSLSYDNVTGVITAPVLANVATTGSYADLLGKPSTVTYNASNIVVTADIIPAQDVTYNLGSPTKRWHSVYIGANTIYLGNSSTLGGTYISVEADPNSTSLAQMPTMTASRLVAKPYSYNSGGGPITVRPSIEFQDKQGVSYPISFNTDTFEFSFDAAGNYGTGSIVGKKATLSNVGGTALSATGAIAHAGDYLNTLGSAAFRFDGNMTIGYDATKNLTVKSTVNFLAPVAFSSPVTFGDGNDTITINPGAMNALNITSSNLTSNANGTTIAGSLTVNGNLNIIGNTSTIHSTNVAIGDNIIILNADMPGTQDPVLDAGFQVARGTAAAVKFVWDETNDFFSPVGQSMGNIATLTAVTLKGALQGDVTGNVTGNVSGNAGTATKLQTARTIAGVAFDGTQNIAISYNDLTNKPTIPTTTSALTNDAGFITAAALIPTFYAASSANSPLTVTAMSITYADTTSGAVIVNLPAAPVAGTLVQVRWDAGSNTLTVGRNGKTIEGTAQDMVFDLAQQQGSVYGFRWTGSTWRVE